MARPQKAPLRPLTEAERTALDQIARASCERADRVARAKALLAVAGGRSFTAAAQAAGRRSGDAVAHLVARFNTDGLAAQPAAAGAECRRRGGEYHRAAGYLERIMAFFVRHFERMITHLGQPGVPRTNNHAERANRRYRAVARPRYGWATAAGQQTMLTALQGFDSS